MTSLAEFWDRAQQLEAQGSRDEARSVYEIILDREPHHVPARLRMSRLEQLADRYLASKEHVWRAADAVREHSNTRNMGYVTARLLEFAEETEVAEIISSANWTDPHVIRQSPALAQHLWLAGHYKEALRFLDAVAERVPAHPLLAYTRANVLRYLGDMQGAEREYEACLAMSPDFPDAHWSLATHSRAQPPLSRIARIRDALARARAGGLEQAHLFYALFREYDAADDIDEAWCALAQGAGIMRQRVAFDSQREASQLDALMRMPMAEPVAAISAAPAPIFIVGMPRTGTTLLDRMLGNHPAVTSLGERNDFSAAVSEASGRFFRSPLHRDYRKMLLQLDFGRVGHLYLQRLRMIAPDARHVIDKNPQNLFNLPIILQALPNAHVLCLRRDPMDACFSNLKELFQGDAYPYSYALDDLAEHCLLARRWMEHWEGVAPRSVRIVDYEDMVKDSGATMAAVLDFAGLEMQGDLHEITRNSMPVSTASSSQVRESIHGRGIGAWKRYERQVEPLRARLGA
jgi:tetratricopeptide (TPR) repeat protein